MKLIEKLAAEFTSKFYWEMNMSPPKNSLSISAYEAGFRKAREMAADVALESFGTCGECVSTIYHPIKVVGEEEAE